MRLDKNKIRNILIEAIRNKGREAFNSSQSICPVKTGKLRNSGNVTDIENGIMIQYRQDYASEVERDFAGGRITVKPYRRQDGTLVKGYSYYAPPRKGQHFIENSLKRHFDGLNAEVDIGLRRNFKSVSKV